MKQAVLTSKVSRILKCRCLILKVFLDLQRVRWKREPQIRGCSSAGRAPALQAGGRQFDSVRLHQHRLAGKRAGHVHGLIAQVVRAHA